MQSDSSRCGDLITFNNGDVVIARLISYDTNKLTYKKYSNLDGPVYMVETSGILMVEFINGEIESFEEYTKAYTTQPDAILQERQLTSEGEAWANTSLALGIAAFLTAPVGGLLIGIVAIIFGTKSLYWYRKNRYDQKGKGKADAGTILGILSIPMTVIGFVLLILLFF